VANLFLPFCGHPTFKRGAFLSDTLATMSDRAAKRKLQPRGELVLVRTFDGTPVERRVWSVGDAVVYVANDEEFGKLAAGKPALSPIGFPKEDVFCRPANKSTYRNVDWSRLQPWEA
jgi:hypothetical protein